MRRLGGWSRIGIVLSSLYGLFVSFIAYETHPVLEYMQSAWFSEAAEVIAESISKAEHKEVRPYQVREALLNNENVENVAWLERVAASPSKNQKEFSAAVAKVNRKHMALIADLPAMQIQHWLFTSAWWVGGSLLLFGMGWTVRWSYRGFRQNAA
jgi:hypothetical protein